MNLKQIASYIAKKEGKKHQASIGDVREILKIIIHTPKLWMGIIREIKKVMKKLNKDS